MGGARGGMACVHGVGSDRACPATDLADKRLVDIALSRAKVHALVLASPQDLGNPWLCSIAKLGSGKPRPPDTMRGQPW